MAMFKKFFLILLAGLFITVHAEDDSTNPVDIGKWTTKVEITDGPGENTNAAKAQAVNRKSLSETFEFKTPVDISKSSVLSFYSKYEAEKNIPLYFKYIYLTDKDNKKLRLNLQGRKAVFQAWAYYVFYLSVAKADADFDYSGIKSITFYVSNTHKDKTDYSLFLSLCPFSPPENLTVPHDNLIVNSNFKLSKPGTRLIPGWSASFWSKVKGTVSLEADNIMKWDNQLGAKGQIYSRTFPVKSGKNYQLKMIVKSESKKDISCLIRWLDADCKVIKTEAGKRFVKGVRMKMPAKNEFVEVSETFKVPANTCFGVLYLRNSGKRIIYYKNISISPVEEKKTDESGKAE